MRNKAILHAANILLSTYNDDTLTIDEKYEIFNYIRIMCDKSEGCNVMAESKKHHKKEIMEVIEELNDVLG